MNNLKKLRVQNNLSQEQLAKETSLSVRFIAFLENGERNPSLETAYKLASYFKCGIEDIFPPKICTNCTC